MHILAMFALIMMAKRLFSPHELNDVSFTTASVFKTLKNLKNCSPAGPDSIKSIFYKKLAHNLSCPLAAMFIIFLEADFMPPA